MRAKNKVLQMVKDMRGSFKKLQYDIERGKTKLPFKFYTLGLSTLESEYELYRKSKNVCSECGKEV